MCMCFEGECRHKKTIKPFDTKKEKIVKEKKERRGIKVNHIYYTQVKDIEPLYFIRQIESKLLFYTGREDGPFKHLNMAEMFTRKQANQILKTLDIKCEGITLDGLKKENKKLYDTN